jgi:hypothetical protein
LWAQRSSASGRAFCRRLFGSKFSQVVLKFRTGNVVAVSSTFLICLVSGNVSNLVGIIMMHGLTIQIITAACADCLQWFYYHCVKPRGQPRGPGPIAAMSALPFLIVAANSIHSENPL